MRFRVHSCHHADLQWIVVFRCRWFEQFCLIGTIRLATSAHIDMPVSVFLSAWRVCRPSLVWLLLTISLVSMLQMWHEFIPVVELHHIIITCMYVFGWCSNEMYLIVFTSCHLLLSSLCIVPDTALCVHVYVCMWNALLICYHLCLTFSLESDCVCSVTWHRNSFAVWETANSQLKRSITFRLKHGWIVDGDDI